MGGKGSGRKVGCRRTYESLDYSRLKRISLAYLYKVMREKGNSMHSNPDKKLKIAVEVLSKELAKPLVDQSNHTHFEVKVEEAQIANRLQAPQNATPDIPKQEPI